MWRVRETRKYSDANAKRLLSDVFLAMGNLGDYYPCFTLPSAYCCSQLLSLAALLSDRLARPSHSDHSFYFIP